MTSVASESVNPYNSLQHPVYFNAGMTTDDANSTGSANFKQQNNTSVPGASDDSGSNQDGASSIADDGVNDVKDRCGASSKQSAASSSGKGSSTGTSPTSAASSSTRSPKRSSTNGGPRPYHHHHHHHLQHQNMSSHMNHLNANPSTPNRFQSLKSSAMYSNSNKMQSSTGSNVNGSVASSIASTSNSTAGGHDTHSIHTMPVESIGATPTASNSSLAGSATGSSTAVDYHNCMPPYRPPVHQYHPDIPPPPFNQMVPPPGATQLMVSSTGVYNQNQPNQPPALYTMTVGAAQDLASVPPPPTASTSPPMVPTTSHHYSAATATVTGAQPNSASGSGSIAANTNGPTRQSNSPPLLNTTSVITSNNNTGVVMNGQQHAMSASPNQQQHTIFVHVNAGETLSVRVGQDIQHIPGPATVRMVSQSVCPPMPLPLHVPPGHLVQQICDDNGILKHLILSPQNPHMSNTFVAPPTTAPGTSASSQSGAVPPGQFLLNAPNGSSITPPPYGAPPTNYSHPPPPFGAPITQTANGQPLLMPNAQHEFTAECNNDAGVYGSSTMSFHGRPGTASSTNPTNNPPQQWTNAPVNKKRSAHANNNVHLVEDGFPDDQAEPEDSRSGTSGVEDEEMEKLMEMLGRVQPIQVIECGAREAVISWQPLDTSEASAYGGPFPQIDASDFTYEIKLSEHRIQDVFKSYNVVTDHTLGSSHQLRVTQLKPSTEYFVRLQASLTERGLVGEPAMPVRFSTKSTIPEKPLPPRLIKRGRNFLTIQWKKPADNGQTIDKYSVELCEMDKPIWSEVYEGLNEQYAIRKLDPNTSYSMRIKAHNVHGSSQPSDCLNATTVGAAPNPPNPPQLAKATPDSLTLSWHRRVGDQSFTVHMDDAATGHGFLIACRTADTTCCIENLRKREPYAFKLVASNDDGDSTPSQAVTYLTAAALPLPPSKLQLKDRVKGNSARLIWDAPLDTGGLPITSYSLQMQTRSGDQHWLTVYTGPEKSHTLHSLLPGTAYVLRVSCATNAGQSAPSDLYHLTTDAMPPHACQPAEISKIRPTSAHIRWACPSNTGGAEVCEYELSVSESSGEQSSSPTNEEPVFKGSKLEFSCTSLQPGTTYMAHVRAINCAGPGAWSPASSFQTSPTVTSAPTDLTLIDADSIGYNQVGLRWSPPSMCHGAAVSEYRVLRAETKEEESVQYDQIGSTSSTSFTVMSLMPNTAYSFAVTAVNSVGASAQSNPFTCTTRPGPPDAPVILRIEPESTSELLVEWQEKNNHGLPVTTFEVECCSDEGAVSSHQCDAPADHVVVGALLPECLYRLRLRAVNDAGKSPWSNVMKASTLCLPPDPPRLELVSASHNTIKVRWHDAKDNGSPAGTPLSAAASLIDNAVTYTLEIENKAGSFSPVFEGQSRSHKISRLNECQSYQLRIRASNSGGAGPWSEPTSFSTTRTPPPALKSAPRVSELTPAGSWQVEWQSLKATAVPAGDRIHYALQMAPANISPRHNSPDEWKTVYEGASQSFVLTAVTVNVAQKLRVLSVRLTTSTDSDGRPASEHTYGAASPTVVFNTQVQFASAKTRSSASVSESDDLETSAEALDESEGLVVGRWAQMSETQWAATAMVVFVALTLLIVWLCSNLLPQ